MKPAKTLNLLYFSQEKTHANTDALEINCITEVQFCQSAFKDSHNNNKTGFWIFLLSPRFLLFDAVLTRSTQPFDSEYKSHLCT